MLKWKNRIINESYKDTENFRFNNYIINHHVENFIGDVTDKVVLDIGCGFGRFLEIFSAQKPKKLVGCDISKHQLEYCKAKTYGIKNIEFYLLDFTSIKSTLILHDKFDVIYTIFVILYIKSLSGLEQFIRNCYESLNYNGKVLICTLDIVSAYKFPDVFSILNFPTKLLDSNKIYDGCPIEINITDRCILKSYYRSFEIIERLMEKMNFKNIVRRSLTYREYAMIAFTEEEYNTIRKSNILMIIEAEK